MRKVVAIVVEPSVLAYKASRLFALCEDGTIWFCDMGPVKISEWQAIVGPPEESD
jgi:hypothetical protein